MPVTARPQDLETAPPFTTLFSIDPDVLANVVASMQRDGYHTTKPIRVWEDAFGTPGRRVVWDGHTRLEAAKLAHLNEVPIAPRRFKSLSDAYEAAVREQRDRRNLTRDQMAAYVLRSVRDLRDAGGNLTRAQLTNLLGVGEASVGRATGLLNQEGNEDLVEQVLDAKLSLQDAYRQSVERRKQPANATEVAEDDDLIEDEDDLGDEDAMTAEQISALIEKSTDPESREALIELATAQAEMATAEAEAAKWEAVKWQALRRYIELRGEAERGG